MTHKEKIESTCRFFFFFYVALAIFHNKFKSTALKNETGNPNSLRVVSPRKHFEFGEESYARHTSGWATDKVNVGVSMISRRPEKCSHQLSASSADFIITGLRIYIGFEISPYGTGFTRHKVQPTRKLSTTRVWGR